MKMKSIVLSAFVLTIISSGAAAIAQQAAPQSSQAPASQPAPPAPGLQMNNIAPPEKIQFPPANPKNFTATSPSTQEVNSFLKQIWGYDPNRVWEVVGIETTEAPGVVRVTILVGEQGVSHSPAPTVFFVTPDGRSCRCRFRCDHLWGAPICSGSAEVGSTGYRPVPRCKFEEFDVCRVC